MLCYIKLADAPVDSSIERAVELHGERVGGLGWVCSYAVDDRPQLLNIVQNHLHAILHRVLLRLRRGRGHTSRDHHMTHTVLFHTDHFCVDHFEPAQDSREAICSGVHRALSVEGLYRGRLIARQTHSTEAWQTLYSFSLLLCPLWNGRFSTNRRTWLVW